MFVFYLLLEISNIIFIKNEKLIFVENIFRHGARAPIKTNDDGNDLLGVKWPAPGEITAIGKRMEYILGLYNRKKYIIEKKFLSEKYDPHELIVFSSDINRTLLSVTSQLQGLYPPSYEKGNVLKPEQYNISVPPFNINIDDFADEIENLNDSAIPNYMTIIPIHFINLKNTTTECADKIKEFNDINEQNFEFISKFTEEFKNNYSTIFNNMYGRPQNFIYDFTAVNALFDAMVVDMTEGYNITGFFKRTGINMDYYMNIRYDILSAFFRDYLFGDKNNEVLLFSVTLLFKDMINYMKRRIEDDINEYPSLKNVSDYSRPRMVMISAHDTTLSAIEMFFIRFFDKAFESYEYPVYTSQITFEITRDEYENILKEKNSFKNLKYSDYKISYYFNEKLFLNITFDKFVEKIENVIWNQEQMDRFCFGTKTNKKNDFTTSLIVIMCMGILIFILIIVIIVLIVKLLKKTRSESWLENDKDKDNKFNGNERIINDEEE